MVIDIFIIISRKGATLDGAIETDQQNMDKNISTILEKNEALKTMKKGQHYFKLGLWSYNLGWGADYELLGYSLKDTLAEAKKDFFKYLEDDEEATIDYYMCISEFEFVGEYENEKGQIKHTKHVETYINDFGTWKTKRQCFKEWYGIDL